MFHLIFIRYSHAIMCQPRALAINAGKMKEMFQKNKKHLLDQLPPVIMTGEKVERLTQFKYRGTILDVYLGFSEKVLATTPSLKAV